MAYDKKQMIKQSVEAIKEYDLIYIEEIFAYVPFGKTVFYREQLNKENTIIKELSKIKIKTKQHLRSQWKESKSPFLQHALYKLCANEDELERLKSAEKQTQETSEETLKKLEEISDKLNKE